jgi:hypothetical protein
MYKTARCYTQEGRNFYFWRGVQGYLNGFFKHFSIPLLLMDKRYLFIIHPFFWTCVSRFPEYVFKCTCRVIICYLRFEVVQYFNFQGHSID